MKKIVVVVLATYIVFFVYDVSSTLGKFKSCNKLKVFSFKK